MRIPGNFDRWMFNYKEGNLSAEEAAYFEGYLMSNPDFAEDVEAWDNAYVRQEAVEYPHVTALMKDKSPWATWKPWAAAVAILLTVAGGIGFGTQLFSEGLAESSNISPSQVAQSKASALPSILYKANRFSYKKMSSLFEQSSQRSAVGNENKRSNLASTTVVQTNEVAESNSSASTINQRRALNNQRVSQKGVERLNTKANDSPINNWSAKAYKVFAKHSSESKSNSNIKKIAAAKINNESDDFSASYILNPEFNAVKPKVSFTKNKTSLLQLKFKQFLNKIDKITGYPIALLNLRDPDLVMPNRNILNFNPAFAGGAGNFRIGADYRNQWSGQGVNNHMNTVYFDTYSTAAKGGIGGSINYSNYANGAYENMSANLFYSPKFVISKNVVFEPAVKVTMGKNRRNVEGNNIGSAIEMNRGNVVDQGNSAELISNEAWYKDYGLGFVLNTKWFYIGGFVDNLAGHDQRIFDPTAENVANSPHLITGVVGFDFQSRNKKTTLSPFLTYYQFGAKKEAWAGATAQFNWLTLGASYSSNNEYAASVGLKFNSFKLIYQIDQTESEFLQESFVSHNIGIRFNTKNKTIR